jgi:hypothetical protein
MTNTSEQIGTFERFRRMFLYTLEMGPLVSPGLERRIDTLLSEMDDLATDQQDQNLDRFRSIMPRMKEEICEHFATSILEEVADAIESERSHVYFNLEFPCYLYSALEACMSQSETLNWQIVRHSTDWSFSGLDVNDIDWRDLLIEGAVKPTIVESLEAIGFGTRLVDRYGLPANETLTEAQKATRPVGKEIEPKIAAALNSLPVPAPGKESLYYCRAMLLAGVDPAFIYAYQKAKLLVTQELSPTINDTVLRAWDEAVIEYRTFQP